MDKLPAPRRLLRGYRRQSAGSIDWRLVVRDRSGVLAFSRRAPRHQWTRTCNVFPPSDWPVRRASWVMRYVDAVALISKCLCHGCFQGLVKALYSVSFKVNPEENGCTWTDVILQACQETGDVTWAPKNPKDSILLTSRKRSTRRIWATCK